MTKKWYLIVVVLLVVLADFSHAWSCKWTAPYFRKYTNQYFGIDYPYQLFIAQGATESHCRARVISNDGVGSQGIGQITWRWWKHKLRKQDIPNLRTIDNQTKAQVYIMKVMYDSMNKKLPICYNKGWVAFQMYNGGNLVLKEVKRAKVCKHNVAKIFCRRKIIHFNNGTSRSACNINYKYSEEIYSKAKRWYGYNPDLYKGRWKFW